MAEKPKRDPFQDFYYEGESEESKQKMREMVGQSAARLVQPTPSAVVTNPELAAKIAAAEELEKKKKAKKPGDEEPPQQPLKKPPPGGAGAASGNK